MPFLSVHHGQVQSSIDPGFLLIFQMITCKFIIITITISLILSLALEKYGPGHDGLTRMAIIGVKKNGQNHWTTQYQPSQPHSQHTSPFFSGYKLNTSNFKISNMMKHLKFQTWLGINSAKIYINSLFYLYWMSINC